MATTGRDIFRKAMVITDNLDENGAFDTQDNLEYKRRAVQIINILLGELFIYSDAYDDSLTMRDAVTEITNLNDSVEIDDALARSVLPYGLASHLMMEENPQSASFYQQRYEELLKRFRDRPSTWEEIEDVYGGIEYSTDEIW
jgi:hypothetical protein